MDFCDANGIGYQIVLTKVDKSNKSDVANLKSAILSKPRPAASSEILETSAEKKIGITALRAVIGIRD
jgi:GTP-binding protein EngB required for normal cell division